MTDHQLTLPPDVDAGDAEIHWTAKGHRFARTPDECFADLPDHAWAPNYADVDGMRMHDVGRRPGRGDGAVPPRATGLELPVPVDDPGRTGSTMAAMTEPTGSRLDWMRVVR